MFSQAGWTLFSKEFKDLFNNLRDNAPQECVTNDDWQIRRGQLDILNRLMTYEEFIKTGYESIQNNQ